MLWIGDAITKGGLQPSVAADHSGGPDSAIEWLRSNYHYIPETLRPAENEIDEFAAFFSTYLTSSFDVVLKPGVRGERRVSGNGWCHCELCSRILHAPYLQTKKLSKRDKRRANYLMTDSLMDLGLRNGMQITEEAAIQILKNQTLKRCAAYVAYGHWLIQRLEGKSDGPAVLVLWRIVAWDPRGGMRSGFTLELEDFRKAENELIVAMRELQ